ncbi:PH and SEC7 domain-containing protein-like [Uloborus diversus]|uniref:PH and SEC7 domain-containing protein-like n=1 Tax=Uloborus diversus TaxID=327109 RepID=UPI002409F6F8|nr:PH and SEC7 domain-containing protein-like [Uloborus diversus]
MAQSSGGSCLEKLEAGDVILEVNDKTVVSLSTKEVLKCLRLSSDVVTLKVKKVEKKGSFSYGGNFVRTSRSEDFLQKSSVATVSIDIDDDIATSLNNLLDTNKDNTSTDKVVWSCNTPVSATGSGVLPSPSSSESLPNSNSLERFSQFVHIPASKNGTHSDENLVSDNLKTMITTSNRQRYAPRSIQPKQDGVTNIMIDENKIYVQVLPNQTVSDENTICFAANNKVQHKSSSDESPTNLKNIENGGEPRTDESSPAAGESKRCYSPEDESDVESLSSFHYSPKAIDMPSASRLAKRLFNLEGFKKSDVSRHLCKNNDFSRVVAEEYLKFFDFNGEMLDVALRKFLKQFCLIGETQERERVLVHFSKRFLDCNPGAFKSQDAVHTLTCALMLLNTDLHGENVGRRMTCAEFVENLAELNEGENFSKEVLKSLYHSIKTAALEWAIDDEEETANNEEHPPSQDQRPSFIGHNPFLEVPNPNFATEYKKGYVMRKCCIDPNGKKTPMGKRGWKMFYADLRDLVLYLHKDENGFRKNQLYDSLHNSIRIHHALATRATDYTKKQHVFRLQTADQAVYLFQTSDSKELQSWIDTINYVAACLSAPSLSGAVGSSQKKFQRPLLPVAPTKLNFREQLLELESKVMKLEKEIEEHISHPPDRSAKSRVVHEFVEKENFLQYELKRYRTYIFLLRSKIAQFPELEPPLVETSIGEVDENLEKNDQNLVPTLPSVDNVGSTKRSLSDRFSYRAAIYKTGASEEGV